MKKKTTPPRQREETIAREDIILKAIPVGKKNALTNRRIAAKLPFKITPEHLRKYIHELRAKGFHVLSNSKVGYWRATGSSKKQKKDYMKYWGKHANSIKKIVSVEKKQAPTKTQIKRYISAHPDLTKKQVAANFKISVSTLYRVLNATKRKGSK